MTLATKITILRIILVVVVMIVLFFLNTSQAIYFFGIKGYQPYWIALGIYIFAALSDAVDGYIARKTNTITNLGKFLDPIADKLLVNSLIIYLAVMNNMPAWCVIIMIARDTLVDGLRMIASENNVVIAASIWGKLKTIFQMVTIGMVLLLCWPNQDNLFIVDMMIYLSTLISVLSGIDYFRKNLKVLKN